MVTTLEYAGSRCVIVRTLSAVHTPGGMGVKSRARTEATRHPGKKFRTEHFVATFLHVSREQKMALNCINRLN